MKKQIICVTLVILVSYSSAFAGRTWFYNEITDSHGNPIGWGNTAIGMRSGNAWPVVAYSDGGPPSSGVVAMLPGSWGNGPVNFTGWRLDGATAPDGTVAFADDQGKVVMLGKTGWGTGSYNGQAMFGSSIAFNSNSVPGVLHEASGSGNLTLTMKSGAAWYGSTVQESGGSPVHTDAFALDFDSYNQANIAFSDGGNLRYGTKGILTGGQWIFSDPIDAPYIPARLDMALTNNDVPYVLYNDVDLLKYAIYDRHSDSWVAGILDEISCNDNFCVTSDNNGGIGVAYVTQFAGQDTLSFAYNNGSGWMGPERLTQADRFRGVGLAFDYENNPVISFVGGDGIMKIAYDPQEVPEPATLAILALGFVLIRRSKEER